MDCLKLQSSARFLSILFQIDREEARQHWGKPCPHCKDGTLAWGNWTRKLRILGVTDAADDADALRFSLCCTLCRRRITPKSVRFAGRSPNPSGVVAFARVLTSRGSCRRITEAAKVLHVSERTIRRWLRFWKNVERSSSWWKTIASRWLLSGKTLSEYWDKLTQVITDMFTAILELVKSLADLWNDESRFLSVVTSAQKMPEASSLAE